jgi:site-specific recombinase XerD
MSIINKSPEMVKREYELQEPIAVAVEKYAGSRRQLRAQDGDLDLYNLRHTFATRSILSGTDVTILQKILGHSEIGMTMRYVKIAEHYKVEAVVKLEQYRVVKMQEAVVQMQEEQQEAEKMGMLQ